MKPWFWDYNYSWFFRLWGHSKISVGESLFYTFRDTEALEQYSEYHPFLLVGSLVTKLIGYELYLILFVLIIVGIVTLALPCFKEVKKTENKLFWICWTLIFFITLLLADSHLILAFFALPIWFTSIERGSRIRFGSGKIGFRGALLLCLTVALVFCFLPLGVFLTFFFFFARQRRTRAFLLASLLSICFVLCMMLLFTEDFRESQSLLHFFASFVNSLVPQGQKFIPDEIKSEEPAAFLVCLGLYWGLSSYLLGRESLKGSLEKFNRKSGFVYLLLSKWRPLLSRGALLALFTLLSSLIGPGQTIYIPFLIGMTFCDHLMQRQVRYSFILLMPILGVLSVLALTSVSVFSFSNISGFESNQEDHIYQNDSCLQRTWLVSNQDIKHFNAPIHKIERVVIVDLKIIPSNAERFIQTFSKEHLAEIISDQEIHFLKKELLYAEDVLQKLQNKKCLGLFVHGSKHPLTEKIPYSRGRMFYDRLKTNHDVVIVVL